jgi:hypothetical protein
MPDYAESGCVLACLLMQEPLTALLIARCTVFA